MKIKKPNNVLHFMIQPEGYFPGNTRFPLLIYQSVFDSLQVSAHAVQALLKQNDWTQSWVDSIYDFHHYHSNTHEVLVIISGKCEVQFGGGKGQLYEVRTGDVVILPAGVAHKSLSKSDDFRCIGAYPFDVGYDMKYGRADEYAEAINNINQVGMPMKDPIFGNEGTLFDYWK